MITYIELENFGGIKKFSCSEIDEMNLVCGENKRVLLKALYATVRAIEKYHRGDDIRNLNEILCKCLRETFRIARIGELAKNGKKKLYFKLIIDGNYVEYSFSRRASKKISDLKYKLTDRKANSIYLPHIDVLSEYQNILRARDFEKRLLYDNTSYELAKALSIEPYKTHFSFADGVLILGSLTTGQWLYKTKNKTVNVSNITYEEKILSEIDRLIANGYLSTESILVIDNLELMMIEKIKEIARETQIQIFASCKIEKKDYDVFVKNFDVLQTND